MPFLVLFQFVSLKPNKKYHASLKLDLVFWERLILIKFHRLD